MERLNNPNKKIQHFVNLKINGVNKIATCTISVPLLETLTSLDLQQKLLRPHSQNGVLEQARLIERKRIVRN
jgi:hypothetical protein